MGEGSTGGELADLVKNLQDSITGYIPTISAAIVAVLGAMLVIYGLKFAWKWLRSLLGR